MQVNMMQIEAREVQANIMMARYYSPSLLRFVSPDPMTPLFYQAWNQRKFNRILMRPTVWDRYAYVLDSPLGYIDSLGLEAEPTSEGIGRKARRFYRSIFGFPDIDLKEMQQFKEKAETFAHDHPESNEAKEIASEARELEGDLM